MLEGLWMELLLLRAWECRLIRICLWRAFHRPVTRTGGNEINGERTAASLIDTGGTDMHKTSAFLPNLFSHGLHTRGGDRKSHFIPDAVIIRGNHG